jgi:hypothetical protein
MTREEKIKAALARLNQRELHAYNVWQGGNQNALAPSLNAKLFNLYLQGKSAEEIRRMNQAISLGQIVAAKVEGEWDERRDEHLDALIRETSRRSAQASMETIDFVCDLLAVANREHGDALRRYLQSGDAKELGDFKIDSIFNLKQTIEILQKLTGADKVTKSTVTVGGEITQRTETISPTASTGKPTSEDAAKVLQLLVGGKSHG